MSTAICVGPCPECRADGRLGYCAPKRCYCRHATCYAAAYARIPDELPDTNIAPPRPSLHMAESWATREEPTWLDK